MYVVDTCVLVDIADDDPTFGQASAQCLATHLSAGLLVSPVTYVELAPVFDGSVTLLDEFLRGLGVDPDVTFEERDRRVAFSAWARHISAKRAGKAPRRPIADVLIGALALRCNGLITRNTKDFAALYPRLTLLEPVRELVG